MRLELTLMKDFNNEANMRAARDYVIDKAEDKGWTVRWTLREE